MCGMGVAYNNEFGDWLRELLAKRGITSSRQVRQRTGISHTTIDDILKGTRPSVETAIRIAKGFGADISQALGLAGYEDIVEAWQGASEPSRQLDEEPLDEYHPDDVPPELRRVSERHGRVYAALPPGKARDQYIKRLEADDEAYLEMLRTLSAEDAE